jgi:hypothetical protein
VVLFIDMLSPATGGDFNHDRNAMFTIAAVLFGTKTAKNSGRFAVFPTPDHLRLRISAGLGDSLADNSRQEQQKTAKLSLRIAAQAGRDYRLRRSGALCQTQTSTAGLPAKSILRWEPLLRFGVPPAARERFRAPQLRLG